MCKSLRNILTVLSLAFVLALPVWADEEKPAAPAEKETKAVEKKDEAKKADEKKADDEEESPILRLAEMRLDEFVVPARMINLPIPGKVKTVQEVLDRLEAWGKDEQIGAVLMDVGNLALSLPDVEELRGSVEALRNTGKKVTAFLNDGSPNGYLLACAADEIIMAPTGMVAIPGVGRVFPFMKGHYQLRGIEFDVISAGRYKYPGFLNEREPNRFFQEEFNAILDGWIEDYRAIIVKNRKLNVDGATQAIHTAIFNANQAQQRGLVDGLAYYDECRERLLRRDKLKKYRDGERSLANVNSLQDMMELINQEMRRQDEERRAVGPKIAVLHARGPIIDMSLGAGLASQVISRDDFVKVVDELRRNKSIKAVVMRIDSPGGSGYASDVIWQQLRLLNEEKPLVASMGTVAGSGGYYIACPARRIFAQPTTITGSIGVLGIFPMAQSMYNRMDYELSEMKRGARSTLGSPHKQMEKEDRQFFQDLVDDFYTVFVDRVALTRRLPAEEVRKIAEGRIYTGRQALSVGLIDELGGMAEAIEAARGMANIPPSAELKIVHYPRPGSLGEVFESLTTVSAPQVSSSLPDAPAMQLLATLQQALQPAPMVSFDRQLMHFATGLKPLCWMAVPDFYTPVLPAASPESLFGFDANQGNLWNPLRP